MTVSFAVFSGIILITVSYATFICDNTVCVFGTCENNDCARNTYICSSSTSICSIQCNSGCNNITIQSSAQETEVLCNLENACDGLSIQISQNETESISNSLLLTCSDPSSCSNINILCSNPELCQCKDNDNTQCNNNNIRGEYTLWSADIVVYNQTVSDSTEQQKNTKKGNAVILITFVILFWIFVCLVVPMYIKRYLKSSRDPTKARPIPQRSGDNIAKDHSVDNSEEKQEPSKSKSKSKTAKAHSTHRRALSNSMMARIKEHKDQDEELKETDVNSAAAMLKYIHTREDGELSIEQRAAAKQVVDEHQAQGIESQWPKPPINMHVSPSMDEGGNGSNSSSVEEYTSESDYVADNDSGSTN